MGKNYMDGGAKAEMTDKRKRILVVEDEKIMADGLEEWLNASGYDAKAVYSKKEALEKARSFCPDAALIDIRLPLLPGGNAEGGVGYQIVSEISKINPGIKKIVFTEYPDIPGLDKIATERGISKYVQKTNRENIMAAINEVLIQAMDKVPYHEFDKNILILSARDFTYTSDRIMDILGAGRFSGIAKTNDAQHACEMLDEGKVDMVIADSSAQDYLSFLRKVKELDRKRPAILVCDLERAAYKDLERNIRLFDGLLSESFEDIELERLVYELFKEHSGLIMPEIPPVERGMGNIIHLTGRKGAGKSTMARVLLNAGIPDLLPHPRYMAGRDYFDSETEGIDYWRLTDEKFDDYIKRGDRLDKLLKERNMSREDLLRKMGKNSRFTWIWDHYTSPRDPNARYSTDVRIPFDADYLITSTIEGFSRMKHNQRREKCILFYTTKEISKILQLDRPARSREKYDEFIEKIRSTFNEDEKSDAIVITGAFSEVSGPPQLGATIMDIKRNAVQIANDIKTFRG